MLNNAQIVEADLSAMLNSVRVVNRLGKLQDIFYNSAARVLAFRAKTDQDVFLKERLARYFARCSHSLQKIQDLHRKLLEFAKVLLRQKKDPKQLEDDEFYDDTLLALNELQESLKLFVSESSNPNPKDGEDLPLNKEIASRVSEARGETSLYRSTMQETSLMTPLLEGFQKKGEFRALIECLQHLTTVNDKFRDLCLKISSYFTTILIDIHKDIQGLSDFCRFCSLLKQEENSENFSNVMRKALIQMLTDSNAYMKLYYPSLEILKIGTSVTPTANGLTLVVMRTSIRKDFSVRKEIANRLPESVVSVFYLTNSTDFYVFFIPEDNKSNQLAEVATAVGDVKDIIEVNNAPMKLAEIHNDAHAYEIVSNKDDWVSKFEDADSFFETYTVKRKTRVTRAEFSSLKVAMEKHGAAESLHALFYSPDSKVAYYISDKIGHDDEILNGGEGVARVEDMFEVPNAEIFFRQQDTAGDPTGDSTGGTGLATRSEQGLLGQGKEGLQGLQGLQGLKRLKGLKGLKGLGGLGGVEGRWSEGGRVSSALYRSTARDDQIANLQRKIRREREFYQNKIWDGVSELTNKSNIRYPQGAEPSILVNYPKDYQLLFAFFLFELEGINNSLIVAPTGSGKTDMMYALLYKLLESKSTTEETRVCWVRRDAKMTPSLKFDLKEWSALDTTKPENREKAKTTNVTAVKVNGSGACYFKRANLMLADLVKTETTKKDMMSCTYIWEATKSEMSDRLKSFLSGNTGLDGEITLGTMMEDGSPVQFSQMNEENVCIGQRADKDGKEFYIVAHKGRYHILSFPKCVYVDTTDTLPHGHAHIDFGSLFPTEDLFPKFGLPYKDDKGIVEGKYDTVAEEVYRDNLWNEIFPSRSKEGNVLLSGGMHVLKLKVGDAVFYKHVFVPIKDRREYFLPKRGDDTRGLREIVERQVLGKYSNAEFEELMKSHGINCKLEAGYQGKLLGFFVEQGDKNGDDIHYGMKKNCFQDGIKNVASGKGVTEGDLFSSVTHCLANSGNFVASASPRSLLASVNQLMAERAFLLRTVKTRLVGDMHNDKVPSKMETVDFVWDEVHEIEREFNNNLSLELEGMLSGVSNMVIGVSDGGSDNKCFYVMDGSEGTTAESGNVPQKQVKDNTWMLVHMDYQYLYHCLNSFYDNLLGDMEPGLRGKIDGGKYEITYPPYITKVSKIQDWKIHTNRSPEKKDGAKDLAEEMFLRWMRGMMAADSPANKQLLLGGFQSYPTLQCPSIRNVFRVTSFKDSYMNKNLYALIYNAEARAAIHAMSAGKDLQGAESDANVSLLKEAVLGGAYGRMDSKEEIKSRQHPKLLQVLPCFKKPDLSGGSEKDCKYWPSRYYMMAKKGPFAPNSFPGDMYSVNPTTQDHRKAANLGPGSSLKELMADEQDTLDEVIEGAEDGEEGDRDGKKMFKLSLDEFREVHSSALFLMANHDGTGPLARFYLAATQMFPVKPLKVLNQEMGNVFEKYLYFDKASFFNKFAYFFYTTHERFSWLFSVSMYYFINRHDLKDRFKTAEPGNIWWTSRVQSLEKMGRCFVQQASLGFDLPVFVPALSSGILFQKAIVPYMAYRVKGKLCGFTATPEADASVIPAFLSLFSFKASFEPKKSLAEKLNQSMTEAINSRPFTLNYVKDGVDVHTPLLLRPEKQYFRTSSTFKGFLHGQNEAMFGDVTTWERAQEYLVFACLTKRDYEMDVPKIKRERLSVLESANDRLEMAIVKYSEQYGPINGQILHKDNRETRSERLLLDHIGEILEEKEKTLILIHENYQQPEFVGALANLCQAKGYTVFPSQDEGPTVARTTAEADKFSTCGENDKLGNNSECYLKKKILDSIARREREEVERLSQGTEDYNAMKTSYATLTEDKMRQEGLRQGYSTLIDDQNQRVLLADAKTLGTGITMYGCRRALMLGFDAYARGKTDINELFAQLDQAKGRIRRLDSAITIPDPTDVEYHIFLPEEIGMEYLKLLQTKSSTSEKMRALSVTQKALDACHATNKVMEDEFFREPELRNSRCEWSILLNHLFRSY